LLQELLHLQTQLAPLVVVLAPLRERRELLADVEDPLVDRGWLTACDLDPEHLGIVTVIYNAVEAIPFVGL